MKYLCRLSLAALIFAAANAGFAQDPSADPANAQPAPVATAVPAPDQPAAQPVEPPAAATAPENAPVQSIEPAPAPVVEQPAVAPPAQTTETKSTKKSTRVTQAKPKPEPKAPAEKVERKDASSDQAAQSAAAAATAASAPSDNPPPPDGGQTAPAETSANPAPPPAPLDAQQIVDRKEQVETKTNKGVGGWVVVGIVALAGAGIYLMMTRRRKEESISIFDREAPTVDRTVTGSVRISSRPGPPVTHHP